MSPAHSGALGISMALYIETELFNRVAEVIARLEPCPMAGRVTVDQVKITLGGVGDMWPASIAPTSGPQFENLIALRPNSSRIFE
jgi:hypothetical protein